MSDQYGLLPGEPPKRLVEFQSVSTMAEYFDSFYQYISLLSSSSNVIFVCVRNGKSEISISISS